MAAAIRSKEQKAKAAPDSAPLVGTALRTGKRKGEDDGAGGPGKKVGPSMTVFDGVTVVRATKSGTGFSPGRHCCQITGEPVWWLQEICADPGNKKCTALLV